MTFSDLVLKLEFAVCGKTGYEPSGIKFRFYKGHGDDREVQWVEPESRLVF